MGQKLASILKDIEDIRTFTDESYLSTSFFAVFLLFGLSEEQRELLATRANELIADRQAFAMIEVSDSRSAVSAVEKVIEKASDERVDVDDLNEMHFCPVIISESAEAGSYETIVTTIDAYLKRRDIQPIWKPFLILDTLTDNAAMWLDAVSDSTRALGSMHTCRCCVLTRKDEKGFAVAEERLLTTVLFVAFLHLVKQTREEIGRYIGYQSDSPEKLYYTAQTVFIENPVITRIFNRMSGLLDRLCRHSAATQYIDMSFIQETLTPAYRSMPLENGAISLLPIYSVMPDSNLDYFKRRLKSFAMEHYLSFANDTVGKKAAFDKIASGFLRSCVRSGLGIDDLVSLIGNAEAINNLANVQIYGVNIGILPPYPASGKYSREVSEVYAAFEQWLRMQIMSIGSELLKEYFRSEEFTSLPRKYRYVQQKLYDEILEMNRIRNGRRKLDTALRLLNDPDEIWLNAEYDATAKEFVLHFAQMALARSEVAFEAELNALIERLYQASRGLSGGSGARAYMKLVSDTCADAGSDIAKSCVTTIGDSLRFPISISGSFGGETSCTYVWGSMENNLYGVWERYHTIIETKSVGLPIKSNERFAFLRVSAAFDRAKILRIGGDDGEW